MATTGFTSPTTNTKPKKAVKPGTSYGGGGIVANNAASTIPTSAFVSPFATKTPTGVSSASIPSLADAWANVVPDNKGSGVGTAGSNPGYNNANTDAMTGAAAAYGYTPEGLAGLYDNATPLTTDLLAAMGITNPGMANQLAQYMDPAIAAQFILNRGQNSSDNSAINFANEYLHQLVTPGGRQPEMDRLVAEILGSGGSDNLLGQYLNAGLTPDQQVSAANALLGQTLSGQSPYAQTAYQRYEKDAGNQYLGNVAKGNPGGYGSYIDYLKASPLAGWVRGS